MRLDGELWDKLAMHGLVYNRQVQTTTTQFLITRINMVKIQVEFANDPHIPAYQFFLRNSTSTVCSLNTTIRKPNVKRVLQ